jgi:hypothetical protein
LHPFTIVAYPEVTFIPWAASFPASSPRQPGAFSNSIEHILLGVRETLTIEDIFGLLQVVDKNLNSSTMRPKSRAVHGHDIDVCLPKKLGNAR